MTAVQNHTHEYLALPIEPEWRPIVHPRLGSGYEISTLGEVKSPNGNVLKPHWEGNVLWVSMKKASGTSTTSARLDKLVLWAFVSEEELMIPEHQDGNGENCRLDNLSWREPNKLEMSAMTAAIGRRRGEVIPPRKKRGRPKKNVIQERERDMGSRTVEVSRMYRCGSMSITVTPEGEIPANSLPKGKLTARKLHELAMVLTKADEMNALMGVQ